LQQTQLLTEIKQSVAEATVASLQTVAEEVVSKSSTIKNIAKHLGEEKLIFDQHKSSVRDLQKKDFIRLIEQLICSSKI